MKKWIGYSFESSSSLTPEFAEFAQDMRAHLKKTLAPDFEIVSYSRGHFYFSAFIKNKANDKLAYISASDVRFFPNEWDTSLLIRTAQHDKDYTGGANNFTTLDNVKKSALNLTK